MKFKEFFGAFRNAGVGVCDAVAKGRNLRIHMIAATWALLLVWTSGYGKWYYIAVLCVSALVIGAECLNSAIETLCDRVTTEKDEAIRMAKDMAAGAVLVCSIAALAVGLFLFVDLEFWKAVLGAIGDGKGWALVALIILPIAAVVMVLSGETKKNDGENAPKDTDGEDDGNGDN